MTNNDPTIEPNSEAQAIIDFATAETVSKPRMLTERLAVQLVPPGYVRDVTDLEQYAANPSLKKAADTVHDTESFIKLLTRHQSEHTVVYVQPKQMTAVAILDDHAPDKAGWRRHQLRLQWQTTPGWTRWQNAHRKMLSQDDFAELVEDGLTEILEPSGAELLELAQSIKATTNAQFRSDRRLTSGQVQLTYHEEIDARAGSDGTMTIPSHITLLLAPIYGAEPQKVTARLRYRVAVGKLTLGVIIDRIEELLLGTVEQEVYRIGTAADVGPIVNGVPNGGQ